MLTGARVSLGAWPLVLGGAVLTGANYVALAKAYETGDLSIVYPVARGGTLLFLPLLGFLVFYKIVFSHQQAFGETMMFVYYAYLMPLTRRIGRGFYEDGLWADTDFIRYDEIGGISWREGEHEVTLMIISRLRNLARRLTVPGDQYGAARRLLRDKIGQHAIHFSGTGLDLGEHDEREDV